MLKYLHSLPGKHCDISPQVQERNFYLYSRKKLAKFIVLEKLCTIKSISLTD